MCVRHFVKLFTCSHFFGKLMIIGTASLSTSVAAVLSGATFLFFYVTLGLGDL